LMTAVLGDFNGDGWNDLATGVPHEAIGDAKDARAVLVQYGTGVGLLGSSEVWNADNVNGLNLEAGDRFGAALTVGDFDGNGVDDLAIGILDRDLAGVRDSGVVAVVYGYQRSVIQNGLSPYDTQLFMQGIDGIANQPEMMDRFGSVLAAGDFDGDVYPLTLGGRCFTFIVLLVGLGIISIPAGIVASALAKVREIEDK
jgi:hypothetical protein